jgi:hypothetical protein
MSFIFVFDVLLAGCLFIYNIWSWMLACSGLTTIEFIGRSTNYKTNNYDYTFTRSRDNLFKIFGTKSAFQMLSPSLRYSAFTGIEWSFQMKDLGFNEFGELADGGGDEENLQKGGGTELISVNTNSTTAADDRCIGHSGGIYHFVLFITVVGEFSEFIEAKVFHLEAPLDSVKSVVSQAW